MRSQYHYRNVNRYITGSLTAVGVISTAALIYTEKYFSIPAPLFGTVVSSLLFTINELAIRSEKPNKLEKFVEKETYPEIQD